MAYSWTDASPLSGFHPRLEPVSAWLFRRNSPFLKSSDADADAASLYAMPVDADGFQPGIRDAWRALRVANPSGPLAANFDAFTNAELDDLLRALRHSIRDPKVHVLPLVAGSALSAEELRRRIQIGTPSSARPERPLPQAPRAIVGIIDHGINIFHHRFRHRNAGSRVAYAWMQGQPREAGRLPFGQEWVQADIEAALAADGQDEDRLLRRIGADFSRPGFHPLGFRASHGTHVLDLAAGFEPDDPAGDELPIIAVSMPPEVSRETSGSMLALPFALGLEYIADRARHIMYETGAIVPVIVNFSFGLTGGPRQGRHRLEQTIDRVAEWHRSEVAQILTPDSPQRASEAEFSVVLAAGNNNLSRGHARARPGAQTLDVGWQLQPADPSANFLEIRCAPVDNTVASRMNLTLSLTPPHSNDPVVTQLDATAGRVIRNVRLLARNETIIGRVSVWFSAERVATVTLALDATDPGSEARVVAPSGEWLIQVICDSEHDHQIDAWILRDDVPGGFRDAGRQSYFAHPSHQTYVETGRVQVDDTDPDAVIRRGGSLNALATTDTTQTRISVGGYVGTTSKPAIYSSAPLENSPERIDVSAISDRSVMRHGVIAAGTRSGSRIAMSGTSVAAPQLVRHLATGSGDMMQTPETDASPRLGARILSS